MDLELSKNLKTAISAWFAEATRHLKDQQHAELKKCMEGDGDVRIVYSMRRNAVVLETLDFAEQTATEIFREDLVPWLGRDPDRLRGRLDFARIDPLQSVDLDLHGAGDDVERSALGPIALAQRS